MFNFNEDRRNNFLPRERNSNRGKIVQRVHISGYLPRAVNLLVIGSNDGKTRKQRNRDDIDL
jgi:hypothetical protein